ncbi:hypothetical protein [Streptomyces longisporoflavus]|uniref:Uncharacterized protein n=1 Tax=Streptomyces longisporoflavus TaxID=28044 RepID=A0ABW7R4A2_9ACTN
MLRARVSHAGPARISDRRRTRFADGPARPAPVRAPLPARRTEQRAALLVDQQHPKVRVLDESWG